MYTQTKAFNPTKAGKTKGMCLQNVRRGYNIPYWQPSAWAAWGVTQQHRNRNIPAKVAVPLFYDYTIGGKRLGHINVRLPDGTIWNDGRIHKDLAAFERSMPGVEYVGWGESINNNRVIIETEDEPMPTPNEINDFFNKHLKRDPTSTESKRFDSRPWADMANYVAAELRKKLVAESAKVTKAQARINELQKMLDADVGEYTRYTGQPLFIRKVQ